MNWINTRRPEWVLSALVADLWADTQRRQTRLVSLFFIGCPYDNELTD